MRDVLQFARPAEPQREATSAVVLLHEIRDLMRSQLEKSDIELTVEDSTEITIHGDQNQLKQVLLNLIRNAAESIGERGKIVTASMYGAGQSWRTSHQRRHLGSGGQWQRHFTRGAKAIVRPILHHQGRGYRPWIVNCSAHHRTARRSFALQNRDWSRNNFRYRTAA